MPNLFSPSTLKQLCVKYKLTPAKKYGQNFLIDKTVPEKMLAAADVSKKDTVIEVGPGFGVLTFALAAAAKKVVAYEIEKKLQPYWNSEVTKYRNLEIVWGNILNILETYNLQPTTYKLVANLPYQITSQIIRFFLELEHPPETMVLMVQKEVGERICAAPGQMSVLAVAVQYYGEPKIVKSVSRGAFWPSPKVDSVVIRIKNKARPSIKLGSKAGELIDKEFFHVVKAGFANKRKLLMKNLQIIVGKHNIDLLKNAFAKAKILEKARAQELSMDQWKILATSLTP